MPTVDWLRKEFQYGYSSGNVLTRVPSWHRYKEERRCGTSYRRVFLKALAPLLTPDSVVMELGPGRGSWTRAILGRIPRGRLVTVDYQDVTPWLQPERHGGRLECVRVSDNSFSTLPAGAFDVFFSWGVLCHNNAVHIREILGNALSRLKPGGRALHMYGDWNKLDAFGWERGGVPRAFRDLPDDDIWWPRNDAETMARLAQSAGWQVDSPDLALVARDGVILLTRPA